MRIYQFCLNTIFNIIGISLLLILIITYLSDLNGETIQLLGSNLSYQCQYKILTGNECGSCGLSRSWVSLSNFNLDKGIKYNTSGLITYITSHLYVALFIFHNFIVNKNINNGIILFIKPTMILLLFISWYRIIVMNISIETYNILLH